MKVLEINYYPITKAVDESRYLAAIVFLSKIPQQHYIIGSEDSEISWYLDIDADYDGYKELRQDYSSFDEAYVDMVKMEDNQ